MALILAAEMSGRDCPSTWTGPRPRVRRIRAGSGSAGSATWASCSSSFSRYISPTSVAPAYTPSRRPPEIPPQPTGPAICIFPDKQKRAFSLADGPNANNPARAAAGTDPCDDRPGRIHIEHFGAGHWPQCGAEDARTSEAVRDARRIAFAGAPAFLARGDRRTDAGLIRFGRRCRLRRFSLIDRGMKGGTAGQLLR